MPALTLFCVFPQLCVFIPYTYLIITGIIGGLQSYTDAEVFAGGHEGARTIVYYIWYYGIEKSKYGLASAASTFLGIVIMIITFIQFKKTKMVDI